MSVKKVIEVEFSLSGSEWGGRRWGRLYCVLGEIACEIMNAQSEGYEIPNDWTPPQKFIIPLVENLKAELFQLKVRARNLQKQIRDKKKDKEL